MKTKHIPVWHLSCVDVSGGITVISFRTYKAAKDIADAYGPELLPEVSGPHYKLVPDTWKESSS